MGETEQKLRESIDIEPKWESILAFAYNNNTLNEFYEDIQRIARLADLVRNAQRRNETLSIDPQGNVTLNDGAVKEPVKNNHKKKYHKKPRSEKIPNAYKGWSESEDNALRVYYRQGLRPKKIGGMLGRTNVAVMARAARIGLLPTRGAQ